MRALIQLAKASPSLKGISVAFDGRKNLYATSPIPGAPLELELALSAASVERVVGDPDSLDDGHVGKPVRFRITPTANYEVVHCRLFIRYMV